MTLSDSELLRKYNVPGPRYTSYPTVPYWESSPTEQAWLGSIKRALAEGRREGHGAAVYVHVPFCESLCTYCGCNTRITRNRAIGKPYVETVLAEWNLYRERLRTPIVLSELHLGGGTPTFLRPEELEGLVSGILEGVEIGSSHEFSIEADPRVTTEAHLKTLAALKFRRLSLGIQDFDTRVQTAVHRVQSAEQVYEVTAAARQLGFTSVNYDLIYGLPFQTPQSVRSTIEAVARLRPDRIAFYAYAHVPWIKPSQRRFTEADLPSGDDKRALYELGRKLLAEAGYLEIGMDHFALAGDSLWQTTLNGQLHRNFMGYTARQVAPLIGLGVSAIGDSWRMFAQNEKVLELYEERVKKAELPILRGHMLDAEDLVLRRHILNLMTRFQTEWGTTELRTDYLELVGARLAELSSDGLVRLGSRSCDVPERGRAFLRNICMAFDARMARRVPDAQLFSKTI